MHRSKRQHHDGSADNHHPEWGSACAARMEFPAEQEAPAPARARSLKRNKRSAKADPLEREIELDLEPGAFIPDRACFQFAGELDGLASRIAKLEATDPARAVALEWVERGLGLGEKTPRDWPARSDLADLERDLLVKMGRGSEALSVAWADYCKGPSKCSYDDLMKFVPNPERSGWHEKAIEAARTADLHSRMELLFETKEFGRLADLLRATEDPALESMSH